MLKKEETRPLDKGEMKVMDYDDVLEQIGELGRFQKKSIAILWVLCAAAGLHVLMQALTGYEPENGFRCKIPGCDGEDWSYNDHPHLRTGDDCRYFVPSSNATTDQCYRSSEETRGCELDSEYRYNEFEFEETFVTRFNLVCDESYKVSLVGSVYQLGLMIGSFMAGLISDVYGRKPGLLFCIIIACNGSLIGAFMPDYWSYLGFRFITAIGAQGLFDESFTLTMELVGAKEVVPGLPWVTQKCFQGNTIQIPYAIGGALLGVAAYFIRDYVQLQWILSAILFIQIPLWLYIPESPRWLISTNRQKEAKALLLRMAESNGKKINLDNVELSSVRQNDNVQPLGITDLFRTKDIRLITIVMLFCWPIITMGYFGLGLSMTKLGGDIFVGFILGALIEIPGYILCTLVIDIWGRKPFFVLSQIMTGVSCIVCGFLEESILRTVLVLTGKLFAAGNIALVYVYTAELYPTVIRNTAVGVHGFVGCFGGILSPIIALYLPTIQAQLPMLIMGGSSMVAGLLSLLLPETLGTKLPEQLQDITVMKENSKSIWTCVWPARRNSKN